MTIWIKKLITSKLKLVKTFNIPILIVIILFEVQKGNPSKNPTVMKTKKKNNDFMKMCNVLK